MNKTIITDPLLDKPKLQIYNANTMKKIFNGNIKYDVDYNVTKELVDLEEFKSFLVEQFPDLEKSLQVSEEYFARLENMFYHLIHCGEKPQDFLNKFMMVIDSRISKVFEDFDKAILNQRSIEYGKISDNYEFNKYRTTLKESIIDISNQLHNDFVQQITPPGYDKKVIKQIEQIIRTWTFLKGEPAIISQYSHLKYGILLHNICNGDPITYGDLVEVNLDQIKHNVEDHQFEKTYPVFMHKKDLVVERLHDILKEREEILPEIDAKNIIKSVINRERRKVYREIYDQLMKHCSELKLKDDLEKDQRGIVDSMNQIKKDFLSLKAEEVYIDIITGRTNVKNIKDMSIHFANTQFFVKLEKFMFQTFNFIEKVRDTLDKITQFKQKEEKYFSEYFGDAIHEAVGIFLKQENEMEVKGRLGGMIRDEFHVILKLQYYKQLKQMLSQQAIQDAMKDENFKDKIEKQIHQNTQNVYLKNVLYGLATDEKEKRKVENDLKKKNRERDVVMQNQMEKINKTILGESDHFNKDLQYFPEKDRSKQSLQSKKNQQEYEIPNLEQSDQSQKHNTQLEKILAKKGKRDSDTPVAAQSPIDPSNDRFIGRSKIEIEDAKKKKEDEIKLQQEKLQLEAQKKEIEREKIKLEQDKIKERERIKKEEDQLRDKQRREEEQFREKQRKEEDALREKARREEQQREQQRKEEDAQRERQRREDEAFKERQRKEEEAQRERQRKEDEAAREKHKREQKIREEEEERQRQQQKRQEELQKEKQRKEEEEKAHRERTRKEEEVSLREKIRREEEEAKKLQTPKQQDPFNMDKGKKQSLNNPLDKQIRMSGQSKNNDDYYNEGFEDDMSNIRKSTYGKSPTNMDFYDEDIEDIPEIKSTKLPDTKKSTNLLNPVQNKKKYDIDEMEQIESDPHDDLGDDSVNMQQKPDTQEADPLKASSLMRNSYAYMEQDFDMLKATNNYIQKTKFGKKFNQNMQDLDSIDSIILVFEEFLQQQSAYFLDFSDGDGLYQLTMKMKEETEDVEQEFVAYIQNLKQNYYQQTQDPNFPPEMAKIYLPMIRANEFGIALIEKNPIKRTVNIFFYQDCPEEEIIQEMFQSFLQNFMSPDFFNCMEIIEDEMDEEGQQAQMYEVNSIKLDDRTLDIINNYPEDSYIPYMLLLFCLIYEKDQDQYPAGVNIQITNETEQRIFYVAQAMKCLYSVIESDLNKLSSHYENMAKKQKSEKDFEVSTITYKQLQQGFEQKFMKDLQNLCSKFQNDKVKKYSLCLIKFEVDEGFQFCIYAYVKRIKDKQVELGVIFLRSIQTEEFLPVLAQTVQHLQDKDVEVKIEVEFSRHYLLYDYNQFSLPLWTHLIQKMNLGPMEAISVMNFSMIPYYTVYDNLE